jgi:hypothetical protein
MKAMYAEGAPLSSLVCSAMDLDLEQGELDGTCAICGRAGPGMVQASTRETFTASEFLHDTRAFCPECNYMYNDNQFRFTCWICTPGAFTKLKHVDVLAALFSATVPFVLYSTTTGKKQGWIRMAQAVNLSKSYLKIGWDMELIHASESTMKQHAVVAKFMQDHDVPVHVVLASGEVPPNLLKRIPAEDQLPLLKHVKKHAKDIAWEWVLMFFPKELNFEIAGELPWK